MSYDKLPTGDNWPQQPQTGKSTTTHGIIFYEEGPTVQEKPKRGFYFYLSLGFRIVAFLIGLGFSLYGFYLSLAEPELSPESVSYLIGWALFFGGFAYASTILDTIFDRLESDG